MLAVPRLRRLVFSAVPSRTGYVHPTSVHILDSYGGDPPRFRVQGMRGTPREVQREAQGFQYLCRSLLWMLYADETEQLRGARGRYHPPILINNIDRTR